MPITNVKNEVELFTTYKENKDKNLENKIATLYFPIVKYQARQQANKVGENADLETYISDGSMGLLKAMHDFDPAQGIKFETYASIKIRGAILDGIRKNDWVPRTIRQNQKKVFQAKETLRNELKRQPTEKEIATFLEMDITEYRNMISDASVSMVSSLEEHMEQNGDMLYDVSTIAKPESPEENVEKEELAKKLTEAMKLLTEKEKLVIQLYYYEDLNFVEIASILEVSGSRVSQLHSNAIYKMRPFMGKYMGLFTVWRSKIWHI